MNLKNSKILQVGVSGYIGGVECFLMDMQEVLYQKGVRFDYFYRATSPFYDYTEFLKKYESKVFTGDGKNYSFLNRLKVAFKLFLLLKKNKNYRIIHINTGSSTQLFMYALIGKMLNRKVIVHSHNNDAIKKGILRNILRDITKQHIHKVADLMLACSKEAALWSFRKEDNVHIVRGGVHIDELKYNSDVEKEMRRKFQLENKIVIGQIGRLEVQKNHEFSLKIIAKLKIIIPEIYFIIIGSGSLESTLKTQVEELQIQENVLFLTTVCNDDKYMLYQMIDIILFPSLFEGFGSVAVEAQAAGKVVLCSEKVSRETIITNNIFFLPLEQDVWLQSVMLHTKKNIKEDTSELLRNTEYDNLYMSNKLFEMYYNVLNGIDG